MSLAKGDQLGHYEVRSTLGIGGMGVVYRAFDSRLEREVAIKQVLAGAASDAQLLREARTASALKHPNICTIHEVLEVGDESFIVMELVEGRSLADLIGRRELTAEGVLDIGRQIADAVAHAHSHGIVHRDLKSSNMVIATDGRVKVLDFGIATRVAAAADAVTESVDTSIAGTIAYMAPEVLTGAAADERSDVWAIGVILYELTTGRRPFDGRTGFELSAAILEQQAAPPQGASAGMAAVILRCLSREPRRRYQSAAEVRAALDTVDDLLHALQAPARATRRLTQAAIVGGIGVAVLAGSWWWRPAPGPSATDVQALAVLPFHDVSGQEAVLVDGMTDALISDLSKIPALRVIARTSVMRYRSTPKSLADVARELNVDAVVDGSVLRDGTRVRVTVALVDPKSQQQRWSETYEKDATDLFVLQREISRTIATELRGQLTSASVLTEARPVNAEAHQAYLRGRYHWNRRTESEVRQSLDDFNRAVALDPTFPAAYVGLAEAFNVLGFYVWLPADQVFPKARAAAAHALTLDPGLAEAHASLAYAQLYYDWDWAGAEKNFQRALQLNDGSAIAHQWYANYLTSMGRWDDALAEMRRARQLDPLSSIASAATGWIHWYARQYSDAMTALQGTLTLDPEFLQAHLWRAWVSGEMGQWAAAEESAKEAARLSDRSPAAVTALARIAAQSGRTSEARSLLEELTSATQGAYVPRYDLALVHLALGNRAKALDLLEEAYARRENQLVFVRWDPRLDPLRKEPRFQALVTRMKFPG